MAREIAQWATGRTSLISAFKACFYNWERPRRQCLGSASCLGDAYQSSGRRKRSPNKPQLLTRTPWCHPSGCQTERFAGLQSFSPAFHHSQRSQDTLRFPYQSTRRSGPRDTSRALRSLPRGLCVEPRSLPHRLALAQRRSSGGSSQK